MNIIYKIKNFFDKRKLRKELIMILLEDKLRERSFFICNHLSNSSKRAFCQFFPMRENYAKEHLNDMLLNDDRPVRLRPWWYIPLYSFTYKEDKEYVINEKYRFIRDVIKLLSK